MADYKTILKSKYPAKEHAKRVAKALVERGGDQDGLIYLEAQRTRMLEDSDHPEPFRQRRFFYYLTGCNLPDCCMTYDMKNDVLTLFIPPIDPEDVIWSGLPTTVDEALAKYDVDNVRTTTELNAFLASSSNPQSTVFAIPNQISEQTTFLSFNAKNLDLLKPTMEACRAIKSEYEIALIKQANEVSTIAHVAVMKAIKSAKTERELEALFLKECRQRDCIEQAYHGIFASGTAAATLHYVHNDAPLAGKLNLLLDAGCESNNYASDITRTFPISGKFSKESREIYDIVLHMQTECMAMLKEGTNWDEVHTQAHRVAIKGLLKLGILRGGSETEILQNRTSVAFFPHGLGHYLGLDTHDTGGDPNYADPDPMFRYLRKRGTLPANSVITVEPGIYFCRFIIEPFLKDPKHAKYIDAAVLDKYWEVGGVRIEDNILITKTGYENLTPTPKGVEEMRKLINGSLLISRNYDF